MTLQKAFLYVIMSLRNVFSTSLVLRTTTRAVRTCRMSERLLFLTLQTWEASIKQNTRFVMWIIRCTHTRKGQPPSFLLTYLVMGLCSAFFPRENWVLSGLYDSCHCLHPCQPDTGGWEIEAGLPWSTYNPTRDYCNLPLFIFEIGICEKKWWLDAVIATEIHCVA